MYDGERNENNKKEMIELKLIFMLHCLHRFTFGIFFYSLMLSNF